MREKTMMRGATSPARRPRTQPAAALLLSGLLCLGILLPRGAQAEPQSRAKPAPQRQRVTNTKARGAARMKVPPKARVGFFKRAKAKLFKKSASKAKVKQPKQETTQAPGERAGQGGASSTAAKKPADNKRLGWRAAIASAREEFQVYRGDRLERWGNRLVVGKSDFDPKKSVTQNLETLVKDKGMEHYYADVNGKQVLHVVVDLAKGKGTKGALHSVLRRVGNETIELNYKAASKKNVYGHVAVRVGDGALYDLTGTRGVAQLPKFLENTLQAVRGTSSLSFARKRSLRRFMESRKDGPRASASIYFGMLFKADKGEVKQTQTLYNQRIKQVKEFNVSGGDGKKGTYSCAQFLTEDVPFFNSRGIGRNVGAKSTASAARGSTQLEAVVVYKMPTVKSEQMTQFP